MAYTWDTVPQEFPDVVNGIEPSTQCWVTRMPHTGLSEDWLCAPTQDTFLTWCNKYIVAKSSDFSYQRLYNVIRFPANAEFLAINGANYVAFRNTDFGTMWWFAFIDKIEYKNPNVSWLHIRIDVLNTWFPTFQKTIESETNQLTQYYERWTPNYDRYLEWLQPETNVKYDVESNIIVETEALTASQLGTNLAGSSNEAYAGEHYAIVYQAITGNDDALVPIDHIPSGVETYLCQSMDEVKEVVKKFDWTGDITNSELLGFYVVPKACTAGYGTADVGLYGQAIEIKSQYINVNVTDRFPAFPAQKVLPNADAYQRPYYYGTDTSIDQDYVPLNYKMYTYPYVSCVLKNGNGDKVALAFERFISPDVSSTDLTVPTFWLASNMTYPCNPTIYAKNYNVISGKRGSGGYSDFDVGLALGELPSLNVSGSNEGKAFLQRLSGAMELVGGALIASGELAPAGIVLAGTGAGLNLATQNMNSSNNYNQLNSQTARGISTMVQGAVNYIQGQFPEKWMIEGNTDTTVGQQINNGIYGAYLDKTMCPAPIARQIDEYFSLYGYAMETTLSINPIESRHEYFDYYKTKNASFWIGGSNEEYGYMSPSMEYKQEWNDIFNRGVRIWWSREQFGQKNRYVFETNDESTIHTS